MTTTTCTPLNTTRKRLRYPGAPSYEKRFAAYELSYCDGKEEEAYAQLRRLYDLGEKEHLPTLIARLKALEEELHIPPEKRIPEPRP